MFLCFFQCGTKWITEVKVGGGLEGLLILRMRPKLINTDPSKKETPVLVSLKGVDFPWSHVANGQDR